LKNACFPSGAFFDSDSREARFKKEEKSWWHLTVMQTHTIPSIKKTIRNGFLDPSAPRAATVRTGDVVGFHGLNAATKRSVE
jgi:hypothetical protein